MPNSKVKILSPNSQLSFAQGWYDIAPDSHFWMTGRLYALLHQFKRNHVPIDQPLRGLEIGCGHGVLRSQIERHSQWTVDGTDLDLGALKNNPSCRGEVYLYDVFDKEHFLKDYYDFIVLYDVIEHIEKVTPFLEACLFHLKPGGYIFLNVPALKSLTSNYDKVIGHFRRYDTKMMAEQFEANGLKAVHINYWGLSFIPLLWGRKIFVMRENKKDTIVEKGFDSKNSFLNEMLSALIKAEIAVMPNPIFGSSVMAIAKKPLQ